jgi:hypothetical protein
MSWRGDKKMTKNQKEKAAGREKHKQKIRAKKVLRKQRKNTLLPTRHTKGKNLSV